MVDWLWRALDLVRIRGPAAAGADGRRDQQDMAVSLEQICG